MPCKFSFMPCLLRCEQIHCALQVAAQAHIESLEEELCAMQRQQAQAHAENQLDRKIAAGVFIVGIMFFLFMCCLGLSPHTS